METIANIYSALALTQLLYKLIGLYSSTFDNSQQLKLYSYLSIVLTFDYIAAYTTPRAIR